MSGIRRDRNIKLPKRSDSSQTTGRIYTPSRPAEGRTIIPKKVEPKAKPKDSGARQNKSSRPQNKSSRPQNNRRTSNRSSGNQRDQKPRTAKPTPLDDEVWARVIEHDVSNNVVIVIGESKMLMGRFKPKSPSDALIPGQRVYIGIDKEKRTELSEMIGMARLDRLSTSATKDLPLAIQSFITDNENYFLKSFFNPAGYLSLKQHAYELLQGIGNKKASQMVEQRGSSGFSSVQNLNESCSIDANELLAKRFLSEIQDRNLQPRLTDLLLPVKA
jgi:predicted nucleic acid-binding OB-fold protein